MKTNFLIVGAEGVKPEARGPHLDRDSVHDCGAVFGCPGLDLDAVALTTASGLGLWHQCWGGGGGGRIWTDAAN